MNPFLFRLFREGEAKVHELNYLFWECTTRCNFHCRHCGSDCSVQSREKDMPLEDFLKVLDTIPQNHRPKEFTVVLTGGEPLLRPDIVEAGREIWRRGFGWGMVTNGWKYDEQMHSRLMGAGMGALTVSLDGLEASHDWMRGVKGSYERVLKAISIFAREPRLNSDVVTCVNKRNLGELQQIYDILGGLGVKQWRLFTIIPIGRAALDAEMHLSNTEFVSLMEFIKAKREAGGAMNVTFSCEGYLGRYEEKVRATRYFCRAGINIASVLIDGRICACPNIDRDRFSQGSIYADNFYEVWNSRFNEFRNRSWARTGRCADCVQWRNCLGGGMHNWHGQGGEVLNCHYAKTI
ncbi:MAG: TIGR04133 family radical SAM/SPASM protein [Bacteroidales bacterium]|nr:TIGR04133 family radical SAM/SPASM protein [Bacteroidales bacterium]MBQ7457931.1 TIGR04133 family radical SAM/SPASM protein [Bacteroidales bacterium]